MAASHGSKSPWACDVCTFENQNASNQCEMCGNYKPSQKKSDDKGWKCLLCTFANRSNFNTCQICGAPNPLMNELTGKQLCGACTAINFANVTQCIVCAQPLNNQIIQKTANGELEQIQLATKTTTNHSKTHNKSQPKPQYANPLSDNSFSGGYTMNNNQYNNGYQQQQQQPFNNAPFAPFTFNASQSFGANASWNSGHNTHNNIKHNHHSHRRKHSKHKSHHHHSNKHKHNYNPNNQSSDDNKFEFKDVSAIFKKDANDKERITRETKEVQLLSGWYQDVYLTKKHNQNIDKIATIIEQMMAFIPQEHWDEAETNKNKYEAKDNQNVCQVCYCEFDENEGKQIRMQKYCNHSMICKACFRQHLQIKIKEDDITPWIPCAAPDCKAPVSCNLLFEHVSLQQLYSFTEGFIRKHLARNNNWIRCGTTKCNYGFMILDSDPSKKHTKRCDACNKKQTVCKDPIQSDKGFGELIKSGVLRVCPKCSLPTMKDKGMCNVMHCAKCGIYWNWKTRETGTSSAQLKNKARMNGTLWEPGELAYQQRLQRSDLGEFKKLLERNGIKYDPNYVRGTR